MIRRLLAVLALLVSLLAGIGLGARQSEETTLTFLDVGQGDCTVFRTAGRTILIDAGPAGSVNFDLGSRVIAPALRKLGVKQIDLLLITHPDEDHIGGLEGLAKSYPIRQVAASSVFREHPDLIEALADADVSQDRVVWLKGPETARLGAFHIDILTPSLEAEDDDNEGSLFIRMGDAEASVVITGDADSLTELKMISQATDWKAQVLKAGHHGSRFSTGPAWLRLTRPEIAVVSCGKMNSYGHPHAEVLDRLTQAGAQVLRTDKDGTIHFTLRDGRFVNEH